MIESTDNSEFSNTTTNVDVDEIAKFDSLAARWWDTNGDFAPLHAINPLRLDFIRQRAPLDGAKVLDVGCGGGILTEALAGKGAIVTGIDMAEKPLAVAKLHLAESGLQINYQHSTAEAMAEAHEGQFDVVTCLEMLEHVPSPAGVIAACSRLVRPGGHVFFSTINRNPKAYLFAVVGAEYVLRLLPSGTHEYLKFIKPSELEHWARDCGLSLRDLTGMHYNPLTKHYSLGPGVDVNYLMHVQKKSDG